MIRKRIAAFSSCRTRVHGTHFTSFREIIGVVGCSQVGLRREPSFGAGPATALSKSSTLTMLLRRRSKVLSSERAGNVHAFDRKRPPRNAKGRGIGRPYGSFFFRIKSSAIRAFGGCLGSKRR